MIRSDTCGGEARDLLLASAAGYLTYSMSVDALVGAIKLIVAGEIFVPVVMMNASIKEAMDRLLTKQEREFLPGLLAGQSNRKIANHLGLSEVTFTHHLNGLSSKLGENKRNLAVRLAIDLGLS
jgi:two-component system nitrate/nitrite response regulator NarL